MKYVSMKKCCIYIYIYIYITLHLLSSRETVLDRLCLILRVKLNEEANDSFSFNCVTSTNIPFNNYYLALKVRYIYIYSKGQRYEERKPLLAVLYIILEIAVENLTRLYHHNLLLLKIRFLMDGFLVLFKCRDTKSEGVMFLLFVKGFILPHLMTLFTTLLLKGWALQYNKILSLTTLRTAEVCLILKSFKQQVDSLRYVKSYIYVWV